MADNTPIEWTRHPVTGKGATWNPITGCTLVSDGCRHCYAARLAATRLKHHPSRKGLARLNAAGEAKFTGEVRFNEEWLDQPLCWKRPRMIFVCAHGDLFHESVPDAWIDRIFAVMALAPQHTFQVLTKRSARMRDYLESMERCFHGDQDGFEARWGTAAVEVTFSPCAAGAIEDRPFPLPNVWLGVSAEDQATADDRIPDLLATPAAIRFVSAEPLLGPIDFRFFLHPVRGGLDQIIVGGESGDKARPMHPDWPRAIRDQCKAADVAFFFKQWGEWAPTIGALDWNEIDDDPEISRFDHLEWDGSDWGVRYKPMWDQEPTEDEVARIGKKRAGRLLDGVEHNGMPSPKEVPAL